MHMVEDERRFDTPGIERKVTAPDSNRKITEELKKYALEHEARYGRFPKTLIFAADGDAAKMDCIALVSFTHTHAATGRLFYGQASCPNGLHCACEFYTHARRHRDRERTREIMAAQSCEMGSQLPRSPANCAWRTWRS
jgi:hypothetical protein